MCLDSSSVWFFDKILPFDTCSMEIEVHYGLTNVLGRSFYSCLNFTWRDLKAEFINSNATETGLKTQSGPGIN